MLEKLLIQNLLTDTGDSLHFVLLNNKLFIIGLRLCFTSAIQVPLNELLQKQYKPVTNTVDRVVLLWKILYIIITWPIRIDTSAAL